MNFKIVLLFGLIIYSFNSFSQGEFSSRSKLAPVPKGLEPIIVGHWKGHCTYQSETKEFTLDVKKNDDDRLQFFWSIYQTGMASQKINWYGYDTAKNEIMLENYLFISQVRNEKDRLHCKLARHTFLAEFDLIKVAPSKPGFKTEDISFQNKDVKLAGTVYIPNDGKKHPAVVFLHGSGPATRWEWAPYFAEKFADMGFVSLIFDKRGCGESTGDWTDCSLDDLTMDAVSALEYLKTRGDVDKSKMGMWGFSNSGWVVANTVNFSNDIAFIICMSGGGQTPRDIEKYGYQNALNRGNFTDDEKQSAMALVDQYLNYLSNGQNREQLLQNIGDAKNKPWYRVLNLERVLPSEEGRAKWAWVGNWDPMPSIERIRIPILLVFGEKDMETNANISADRWKQGLASAGNTQYSLVVFKGANHGIRLGEHNASAAIFWQDFAPGYVDTVMNWAKKIKDS